MIKCRRKSAPKKERKKKKKREKKRKKDKRKGKRKRKRKEEKKIRATRIKLIKNSVLHAVFLRLEYFILQASRAVSLNHIANHLVCFL